MKEKKKKPRIRRTPEGGVLSPGRPRKKKTEAESKPKKPAKIGRPKGSVDTVNHMTRNNIRTFLNQKYDDFVDAFDSIEDPYQKTKVYTDVMNFVYPKMRSVDFTADEGKSTLEAKMLVLSNQALPNSEDNVEDVSHEDIS